MNLRIKKFEILIQENEMINDIKNLHLQVLIFKASLNKKDYKDLKDKVLEHIKDCFYKEISSKKYLHYEEEE